MSIPTSLTCLFFLVIKTLGSCFFIKAFLTIIVTFFDHNCYFFLKELKKYIFGMKEMVQNYVNFYIKCGAKVIEKNSTFLSFIF